MAGGEPEFIFADEQVLAYRRKKDNNEVMVILNLSGEIVNTQVPFGVDGYTAYPEPAQHVNEDGFLELSPWDYGIYVK